MDIRLEVLASPKNLTAQSQLITELTGMTLLYNLQALEA